MAKARTTVNPGGGQAATVISRNSSALEAVADAISRMAGHEFAMPPGGRAPAGPPVDKAIREAREGSGGGGQPPGGRVPPSTSPSAPQPSGRGLPAQQGAVLANLANSGTPSPGGRSTKMETLLEKIVELLSQKGAPASPVATPEGGGKGGGGKSMAASLLDSLDLAINDPKGLDRKGQSKGGFFGRAQSAAGQAIGAMRDPSELRGIGGMMGAAGTALGGIPGVGPVIEGFGKLGKVLMEALDRLNKWSDQLTKANLQFAEFSGAMSLVAARAQVREFELGAERGGRRSDTAERLSQAQNRLNRVTAPVEDRWANFKGEVAIKLLETCADVLTWVKSKLPEWLVGKADTAPPPTSQLGNWFGKDWLERFGRPNRFNP